MNKDDLYIMKKNLFEGKLVRLRAVKEEDWQFFHTWDENSETARNSYSIPFPRSPQGTRQWVQETSLSQIKNDQFRFVIEKLDGQIVGTLNTHNCDSHNGTFSYGIAIVDNFRHHDYATEAILLTLNYFFKELRYQKCTVGVYSFNIASIKLHEKLQFTREGRIRRMEFSNGQYHDHIQFGITIEEFDHHHGARFKHPLT